VNPSLKLVLRVVSLLAPGIRVTGGLHQDRGRPGSVPQASAAHSPWPDQSRCAVARLLPPARSAVLAPRDSRESQWSESPAPGGGDDGRGYNPPKRAAGHNPPHHTEGERPGGRGSGVWFEVTAAARHSRRGTPAAAAPAPSRVSAPALASIRPIRRKLPPHNVFHRHHLACTTDPHRPAHDSGAHEATAPPSR
jgi:hypothetical protein